MSTEAGTEASGRPRANRAEDWSARPPEEGCWGLEPVPLFVAAAAVVVAAPEFEMWRCESDAWLVQVGACGFLDVGLEVVEKEGLHRPDPEVLPRRLVRGTHVRALVG